MLKEKSVVMLATNQKANGVYIHEESGKQLRLLHHSVCNNNVQHLYILSDEEIKEGDWYLDNYNNSIIKANINSDHKYYVSNCKKIIATTDKLQTGSINIGLKREKELIAIYLPSPSPEFVKVYIKAYNTGKPITEVMVKYVDNGEEDWIGNNANGQPFWNEKWKLKVDSNNCITIRPVKINWTREEVIQLIFLAYNLRTTDKEVRSTRKMNEWIQQNL